MKKIKQLLRIAAALRPKPYSSKLSYRSRSMQLVVLLTTVWIGLQSCSKKDIVEGSEQPRTSFVQFLLFKGENHSVDDELHTSVKLRLTVSKVDFGQSTKMVLWDTLITRSRLSELERTAKVPSLTIKVPVLSTDQDKILLAYHILYNKNGEITNDSGNSAVEGSSSLDVKIGR